MKAMVAEPTETISIFYVALYADEHSGTANCPQRTMAKCHQKAEQVDSRRLNQ